MIIHDQRNSLPFYVYKLELLINLRRANTIINTVCAKGDTDESTAMDKGVLFIFFPLTV